MKNRIFGLMLFLVAVGGLLYDWHMAINYRYYYIKVGIVTPMGIIMGLVFMVFGRKVVAPTSDDVKPKLSPRRALLLLALIFGGLGLGFINVFLLAHFASR